MDGRYICTIMLILTSPYLTSIAGKASGTAVAASISEEIKELVSQVKNDIRRHNRIGH